MCQSEAKSIIVEHVYGAQTEPYKIKLEKNTKGYNFEISVSGSDLKDVIARIDEANQVMAAKYGTQGA